MLMNMRNYPTSHVDTK